jgi:hypothetical protein
MFIAKSTSRRPKKSAPNLKGGLGKTKVIKHKEPAPVRNGDRTLVVAELYPHSVQGEFILHIIEDLNGKEVFSKEIVQPKNGRFTDALSIASAIIGIDPKKRLWYFSKDANDVTIAKLL